MKKAFILLFIVTFSSFHCKKNDDSAIHITLYDKSLKVTQSYIKGKWKVHYIKGGICGTCKYDREQFDEYYEFLPNNRIKYTFQDTIKADTIINWIRYKPTNNLDSITVMEFFDKRMSPNYFEATEIYNDTLILYNPDMFTPDAVSYYLTKSN